MVYSSYIYIYPRCSSTKTIPMYSESNLNNFFFISGTMTNTARSEFISAPYFPYRIAAGRQEIPVPDQAQQRRLSWARGRQTRLRLSLPAIRDPGRKAATGGYLVEHARPLVGSESRVSGKGFFQVKKAPGWYEIQGHYSPFSVYLRNCGFLFSFFFFFLFFS